MYPVFTGKPASKNTYEVNRTLLVHFVEEIQTNKFHAQSNIDRLHVKQFLTCFISSSTFPAKNIGYVTRAKACKRSKSWKLTIFTSFPDSNL